MKKIAETERLLLRELTPEDAEHFFNLNQNPNVIKYTGDSSFTSVEEARNFLKNYKIMRETVMEDGPLWINPIIHFLAGAV